MLTASIPTRCSDYSQSFYSTTRGSKIPLLPLIYELFDYLYYQQYKGREHKGHAKHITPFIGRQIDIAKAFGC